MYVLPNSMTHAEQKEEQCVWMWSEPNTALELVHNTVSGLIAQGRERESWRAERGRE